MCVCVLVHESERERTPSADGAYIAEGRQHYAKDCRGKYENIKLRQFKCFKGEEAVMSELIREVRNYFSHFSEEVMIEMRHKWTVGTPA